MVRRRLFRAPLASLIPVWTVLTCAAAFAQDATERPTLPVPAFLQPGPNGTFVYRGSGFNAVIRPDGTVNMDNRYGRGGPFGGTFDLTAIAEHWAGNDPYLSERRAFMEETRVFRDLLASLFDQQNLMRKLLILRSTSALPIAERRARTFAIWDEMTEDEKGREGRALLEGFVREFYANDEAFTLAELQRLNAGRQSKTAFDPYRPPEARAGAVHASR